MQSINLSVNSAMQYMYLINTDYTCFSVHHSSTFHVKKFFKQGVMDTCLEYHAYQACKVFAETLIHSWRVIVAGKQPSYYIWHPYYDNVAVTLSFLLLHPILLYFLV